MVILSLVSLLFLINSASVTLRLATIHILSWAPRDQGLHVCTCYMYVHVHECRIVAAMVPPAILSIVVGYLDCYSTGWVLICLILAEAFTAGSNAALYISFLDMAPRSGMQSVVCIYRMTWRISALVYPWVCFRFYQKAPKLQVRRHFDGYLKHNSKFSRNYSSYCCRQHHQWRKCCIELLATDRTSLRMVFERLMIVFLFLTQNVLTWKRWMVKNFFR